MKRLILTIVCFLAMACFTIQSYALEWHTANQSTVGWTEVTTMGDGAPIPAGSIITYQTYLVNVVTDPNKENPADTGIVETNEKTFTLGVEGKFYVGVQTIREVDGEMLKSSAIAWSDIAEFCKDGITFGLRFYLIPDNIEGLYPK